jgi:hypothetical protein
MKLMNYPIFSSCLKTYFILSPMFVGELRCKTAGTRLEVDVGESAILSEAKKSSTLFTSFMTTTKSPPPSRFSAEILQEQCHH